MMRLILIAFVTIMICGCGGQKEINSKVKNDKVFIEKVDTTKLQPQIINRLIDSEMVTIDLKKDFGEKGEGKKIRWQGKHDGSDYILKVLEIIPGVVLIPEYFEQKRWDEFTNEQYIISGSIPKKLEFYDADYNLINTYDVEINNPFLKDTIHGARLVKYFNNIAEYYTWIPEEKQNGNEDISVQWVYADVNCQGQLTIIKYRVIYATDNHFLIGSKYHYTVLDTLGVELSSFETNHQQLSGAAFSPDGKYAMIGFTNAETVINAGIKSGNEGYEIWDLHEKRLLHRESNNDPGMWITKPTYGSKLKILSIGYTYPGSNTKKYRENPNNPISLRIHFNVDNFQFYEYIGTVKDDEERINRLVKGEKKLTWEEIFPSLNIVEKTFNYGN